MANVTAISPKEGQKSGESPALAAKLRAISRLSPLPSQAQSVVKVLRRQGKACGFESMAARLSRIVKTASAIGFAHYSTARKIAPAVQVRFSNAVPYRSVVFTIRGGQINARLFPTLLGRPLRSRLIRSGRRLAERNALPAYACGNARRRVLSLGEDATPAMLSAEPSESFGLVRLPGCKHLYRGILPAANQDCKQSRLAAPLRAVRTVSGFAVHRPAVPKQRIAAFAVNPLQAASSLTAYSPRYVFSSDYFLSGIISIAARSVLSYRRCPGNCFL